MSMLDPHVGDITDQDVERIINDPYGGFGADSNISISREHLARLLLLAVKQGVVEAQGHLHPDAGNVCWFDAGSEREVALEDPIVGDIEENLLYQSVNFIWHGGFALVHGEDGVEEEPPRSGISIKEEADAADRQRSLLRSDVNWG